MEHQREVYDLVFSFLVVLQQHVVEQLEAEVVHLEFITKDLENKQRNVRKYKPLALALVIRLFPPGVGGDSNCIPGS